MKDFDTYINEKLKLDDISKMTYGSSWVDAKKLKLEDLKEGYIIQTNEDIYNRYIYIPVDLATKILNNKITTNNGYVFIQQSSNGRLAYLSTDSYEYFPKYHGFYEYAVKYSIIKVYTRYKIYKNLDDLKNDLSKIYKF